MQHQGQRPRGAVGPRGPGSFAAANIEQEEQRLDALLATLTRGPVSSDAWDELASSAKANDRVRELALAFESVSQGKRIRALAPALAAEFLFQSARFHKDVVGDDAAAIASVERALAAAPMHAASFQALDELLRKTDQLGKLADTYALAAPQRPRAEQASFLRRAVDLLTQTGAQANGRANAADDKLVEWLQQILRVEPGDEGSRSRLETLFLRAGRFRDVVRLDEMALAAEPGPAAQARAHLLGRIVDLYAEKLQEPERALPHIEQLLALVPAHEGGRRVAQRLLAVKGLSGRAAAALATAYESVGAPEDVAKYLALELESTRGPKRALLFARLGRLKQDRMGDAAAAFEAYEQALQTDSDDDVRARYANLAAVLGRNAEAAKTLTRLLATVKDPVTRAKTAAELGEVLRRTGDTKRAKAVLTGVLSSPGAPDAAQLGALHVLLQILETEQDERALCELLARLATIETDPEKRRQQNERLAEVATKRNDTARAMAAFEGLLSTRSRWKARRALATLYEEAREPKKLAGLLEDQAKETIDPAETRVLLMKAATVRSADSKDAPAAIATCDAVIERFGAASDVLALLLPLLEAAHLWDDLSWAWIQEASLCEGSARAAALARAGLVKLQRQKDVPGAIEAMSDAIAADPLDATARAALEKLAASGDHRLAAAAVLEPIYRREGVRAPLMRVLETRASLSLDLDERLSALRESADLAAASPAPEPARALEWIARGLGEAAGGARPTAEWLERLDAAARPGVDEARRATILASALGDGEIDTEERSVLAKRAGAALAAVGDAPAAMAIYRRALSFEPRSTELLSNIDDLLQDRGSAKERIALYREALETAGPERQIELLHRIGTVQRAQADTPGAIETYTAVLERSRDDAGAAEALEELYAGAGRVGDLHALLEGRVTRMDGDAARAVRLRLAGLAAQEGDRDGARAHCERLLGDEELSPFHLEATAHIAEALGDPDLQRAALDRRIGAATEPSMQVAYLEALGVLDREKRGDPQSAAASWKRAAALSEGTGDAAAARRLYGLAHEAMPDDVYVTTRLLLLCERAELWTELPRLYVALTDQTTDNDERVRLALRAAEIQSVRLHDSEAGAQFGERAFEWSPNRADVLDAYERLSVAAGTVDTFEKTVAEVIARAQSGDFDPRLVARMKLARARAMAGSPAREAEGFGAYRELLDDSRFEADHESILDAFARSLAAAGPSEQTRASKRWTFDWRARHASEADRASRWLEWAREEETSFGDAEAAFALYGQVLARVHDSEEALTARARLALATGRPDEALTALFALRDRCEGSARTAMDREIARITAATAGRRTEALSPLERLLSDSPGDAQAIALLLELLAHDETRGLAMALLLRACDAVDEPHAEEAILAGLLGNTVSDNAGASRREWFERLCDLQRDRGDIEAALATAVRAARELPNAPTLWTRAEALSRKLSRPDDVAALFEDALSLPLSREQAAFLGERAVQFYEEWFEDSSHSVRILGRVLEIDPAYGWAFERLKLLLDAAERWDDLFAAYDRALSAATGETRARLLEDAAQTAKDFADRPDRAIAYFEQLREQKPSDAKLSGALERLYERQGKHRELVSLLTARLPALDPEEGRRARTRIATLWLDALGDPGPALDVLEPLLERDALGGGRLSEDVARMLERILAQAPAVDVPLRHSTVPPARDSGSQMPRGTSEAPPGEHRSVRQRAAAWLRDHYRARENERDLARMLLVELETMSRPNDRVRRHVRVAELFEHVLDLESAFDQISLAVIAAPEDEALRARLWDLAERAGFSGRFAEVLTAAAAAAETAALSARLLLRAASLRAERLGDPAGAIDLLSQVLADRSVSEEDILAAAHKLEPLLEAAGAKEEQLRVVERIAEVAGDSARRSEALGRAAHLAVDIGLLPRAIGLWEVRLGIRDDDVEALDELVLLLGRERQHERLIQVLDGRARVSKDAGLRRDDLVRVATLLGDVLDKPARAASAWRAIETEFGEADDSTQALATIFRASERWQEFAEVLERSARRAALASARATYWGTLGDVRRERLRDPRGAIAAYASALGTDPRQDVARAGLSALATGDEHSAEAISVLLGALRTSGDWLAMLDLTPARLAAAPSPEEKLSILIEAARTAEEPVRDAARAFDAVRQAFAMAPGDRRLYAELMRLAEAAGTFAEAVAVFRAAIDDPALGDPDLAASLWRTIGVTRETRLGDAEGALEAYLCAARIRTDPEAALAAARVAAGLGKWDVASRVIVELGQASGETAAEALDVLEHAAAATAAWDDVTRALADAICARGMTGTTARDFVARIAAWHLEKRMDEGAAETALALALSHDPSNVELLASLARLQRRKPDRRLVTTLIALSEANGGSLALLRESSEIAAAPVGDRALAIDLAQRTLDLARTRFWSPHPESDEGGDRAPRESAQWAVEALARLHEQSGDAEAVLAALTLGETLAFDLPVRLEMRRRAARTALEQLHDADRAMALYWPLFDHDPAEPEAATRLLEIYASKDRSRDLVRVRRRQIDVATDAAVRIALRLEAARLLAELGEGEPTVEVLRANLDDVPGHAETVQRLAAVLEAQGRNEELRALLCAEAERSEAAGETARAGDFWARAARVAEERLGESEAAAHYHGRVVAIEARPRSLEALARLAHERGEHAASAEWLERWLEVEPRHRVGATLRLAEALMAAGKYDRATERLERALAESPDAEPLRGCLAAIYQARGDLRKLAQVTAQAAAHAPDKATRMERLLAAAKLFAEHCEEPESAVPLLEQAADLSPDDQAVRLALAEALAASGRHDDARAILRALIDSFGGRRPKERAPAHYQMARLELLAGHRDRALMELDTAAKVDPQNPEILGTLAKLAREDGQFERAEKSYRALLVILRRREGGPESRAFARSEVLLELSAIAERRGELERAKEILESALEVAGESELERERLEIALRKRGDYLTLVRALELRLARLGDAPEAAAALTELADVLANRLGRDAEAFDIRMRAATIDPRSADAHDAAMAHARAAGRIGTYMGAVTRLAEAAEGAGDRAGASALWVRLATLAALDLGDDRRCALLCERAIALGPPSAAALRTLEQAYERLGEDDARARVLALRVDVETEDGRVDDANDALYELSALRLGSARTLTEGVTLLRRALAADPRFDLAENALRTAVSFDHGHEGVLELYEWVGREPGQERILASALALRARLLSAASDTVREAADVAMRVGDPAGAEALLEGFATREARGEDGRDRTWAFGALAELREAAGDVRGAIEWKRRAATAAQPEVARRLRFEIARVAIATLGDLKMASEALEALHRADPADREAWEPLLDVYRQRGDAEKVVALLGTVVDYVDDGAERAHLRLERVRLMTARLGAGDAETRPLLQEILDEDANQAEAALLLVGILERAGATDDLARLLARQVESAKDRGDAPSVASLACRLGGLLVETDPSEARSIYYAALEWAPHDRTLLDALSLLLTGAEDAGEHADILERRLLLEEGPRAETMALALFTLRTEAGDEVAATRALGAGYRAYPQSATLSTQLENVYRARGDFRALADLWMECADAALGDAERAALLRRAAAMYRSELADPKAAADALGRARQAAPEDRAIHREQVTALVEAGDIGAAVAELGRAIDALDSADGERALLFATRAGLRTGPSDTALALEDAEAAFALSPESYRTLIVDQLRSAIETADSEGDLNVSHVRRLRLGDVLRTLGDADAARRVFVNMVRQDPKDRAALRALASLEVAGARWDTACTVWRRLVSLEEGEAATLATLALADACTRAGRPGDARGALERACIAAPADRRVRDCLETVYEAIGAWAELSRMALESAGASPDPAERFALLVRGSQCLVRAEDLGGAASALSEALLLRPGDLGCVALLFDAYFSSSKMAEAAALVETAILAQKGRRARELSPIYWRTSLVARENGDVAGEVRALGLALESDPQNGDVCASVALRALELDEAELAARSLRAVTLLRAPGPMSKGLAYQYLGELAHKQGDARKALTLLRRAVTEDPSLEAARNLAAELERNT